MKFHREEYLSLMTFRGAPRPMFSELFGPLIGLEEEWKSQGATPEELDLTAFDWDWVAVCSCGGNTGILGAPATQVLEETPEYRIERDGLGRTMKLLKTTATIALPLDFPVRDMDDWIRLKPHFEFHPSRIDEAQIAHARAYQQDGALVVAGMPGGFDMARELMGEENACLAYYDAPDLMQDIVQTLSDTSMKVLSAVSERITIDQISVHEDLAGKSGSLIGPSQIREFLQPYYRRIKDMLFARGTQIFAMDSDGDLNAVIPAFLECGLTEIYPMEPAANMDIVALRQQYGQQLAFRGGIDKHVLRGTKDDIRRELEYKLSLGGQGGVAFGLDHRIPNGTPLENYRYYVDLGREMLGLPPRTRANKGWARMAF